MSRWPRSCNALTPGTPREEDGAVLDRRRGDRERGQDRARPHQAQRRDRLRRRVPRPHAVRRGADRQGAAVQGRLRAVPGRDLPRALPRRRTGAGRDEEGDRSTSSRPTSSRRRVAAIIFEPVQGEGGFNVIQADGGEVAARAVRRARHRADRRRGADRLRPHRQAVRDGALRRRRCPTS